MYKFSVVGNGVVALRDKCRRRLTKDNVVSTWGRCGLHVEKEMKRTIGAQKTPHGIPWPRHKAKAKALDGWDGKVKVRVSGRRITYYVRHKWAALHNAGRVIRSKAPMVFVGVNGWVRTRKVVIPARQFMASPKHYYAEFDRLFEKHVFGG